MIGGTAQPARQPLSVLTAGASGLIGGRLIEQLGGRSDVQIRAASRVERSWPRGVVVSDGRLADVQSERAAYAATVRDLFARIGDEKAYVLAECGVGLNPLAHGGAPR